MARKHRKLFPAVTSTNQTQDCPNFCDPACPSNCYYFPDYYLPPPPPPPPSIFAANHSGLGNHISSYLIILASLFTVIFVVVGFFVIKAKCYDHWCGWRGNGSAPSQSDISEEEFLNENQVDHPIWLITTVGLQQSIINSITVFKYKKSEGFIEGTECSVCLNEFQEDETLRLLPKCNHAFHTPCIDTWLRSHINCPLCRAGIISNNVSPEAAMATMASVDRNTNNFGRNQASQTERSSNNGQLSNNMPVIDTGISENRGEAGEAQDSTDEPISKESLNIDRNHVLLQVRDQIENHQDPNDEMHSKMRSISMDCRLAGGSSCPGLGNFFTTEPESHPIDHIQDDTEPHVVTLLNKDGEYSTVLNITRRSSIAQRLHIRPVSMKRSFSCSGRILCTRGYRNLNTSLPY